MGSEFQRLAILGHDALHRIRHPVRGVGIDLQRQLYVGSWQGREVL